MAKMAAIANLEKMITTPTSTSRRHQCAIRGQIRAAITNGTKARQM